MSKLEHVCDNCRLKYCPEKDCFHWRQSYMAHQNAINGYARKHGIKPIIIRPTEDPCKKCGLRYYCDDICPARAAWWDVVMEKLRGEMNNAETD